MIRYQHYLHTSKNIKNMSSLFSLAQLLCFHFNRTARD